ncbi:MAG: hypothetical protein ACYC7E_22180 [Armatimonadota bacterium]
MSTEEKPASGEAVDVVEAVESIPVGETVGAADTVRAVPPPPPVTYPASQEYSNVQPLWQFILLSICTFNLYILVWLYRNWKLLKLERDCHCSPLIYTIFNVLFIRGFFKEVFALATDEDDSYKPKFSPVVLAVVYLVIAIAGNIVTRLSEEVTLLDLFGLLLFFPLLPAVQALNTFWVSAQPGRRVRTHPSVGAIIVFVLGGIFFLFGILGSFMQEK